MGRTPNAKNRTTREIRKDGEHQITVSKLKEKNAAQALENAALKRENRELKRKAK